MHTFDPLRLAALPLSLVAVALAGLWPPGPRAELAFPIQGRPPVAGDAAIGRFQAELDALRAELGFPGATAAWITADGREGTAATGLADRESGRRMPPEARMLAASIGKTFVAATVLALAGEGELDLDGPVARWLGDRPWFHRLPNGPSITIRHLLNHTSGLPDHVYDADFRRCWAGGLQHPELPPPPPDSLVAFVLDDPALFRPGEGWAYSDTGYLLLGMVVEEASGRSVFDQIQSRFLHPLGLSRTSPSDRRSLGGLVPGYVAEDNPYGLPVRTTSRDGEMVWDPAVEGAGGGLVSHPRDLARWALALYRGAAMPGPYLEELLAAVPVDEPRGEVSYGAGVAIRRSGPLGASWGHAGSIPGYVSSMRYYPGMGIAVAFQVNTDGCFAEGVDPAEAVGAMEIRLARAAVTECETAGTDLEAPPPQPRSDP